MHSPFQTGDNLTIYTDSQYELSVLLGSAIPTTHHQLVVLAQQYYTALRCCYEFVYLKVPSHEGIPGSELAESLAKRGATSFGTLGRFSSSPSAALRPPDTGFDQQKWTSLYGRAG